MQNPEQQFLAADLQSVQQYLEKLLPKDQAALQYIYSQLKNYNTQKNSNLYKKQVSSSSKQHQKNISERAYHSEKKIRQFKLPNKEKLSSEDTKKLIEKLKEGGLKFTDMHIIPDEKAAEKKVDQILKPLQLSPLKTFFKRTQSDHLLQKYKINKKYYDNKHFDRKIKFFEGKMARFVERKDQLYQDIIDNKLFAKEEWVESMQKKFKSIQSKYFQNHIPDHPTANSILATSRTSDSIAFSQHLQRQKSVWQQKYKQIQDKTSIKQVFYQNERRSKSMKNLPEIEKNEKKKEEKFNKFQLTVDQSLLDQIRQGNLEKESQDQYYQRYSLRYISMLKPKVPKIGLNKYGKDLRRDSKKLKFFQQ